VTLVMNRERKEKKEGRLGAFALALSRTPHSLHPLPHHAHHTGITTRHEPEPGVEITAAAVEDNFLRMSEAELRDASMTGTACTDSRHCLRRSFVYEVCP
jgi:hypothetical protein